MTVKRAFSLRPKGVRHFWLLISMAGFYEKGYYRFPFPNEPDHMAEGQVSASRRMDISDAGNWMPDYAV